MAKMNLERVFGSAPWLKLIDKQRSRPRIFESGNSLAARIPAGPPANEDRERLTARHRAAVIDRGTWFEP